MTNPMASMINLFRCMSRGMYRGGVRKELVVELLSENVVVVHLLIQLMLQLNERQVIVFSVLNYAQ